jgi:hypothetical protein
VGLEVGMGSGVIVGITGVFPSMITWVGEGALGGMKGVGVGGGAQAGDRRNTDKRASRVG